MKYYFVKVLLFVSNIGPVGLIVADKMAHAFGICLGAH